MSRQHELTAASAAETVALTNQVKPNSFRELLHIEMRFELVFDRFIPHFATLFSASQAAAATTTTAAPWKLNCWIRKKWFD